jgi:peptidyl-prolyl cis-trans isomerase C
LGLVASCEAAPAGGKKAKPAGDPVASIAGDVLTVETLQKKLDDQSPFVRARYAEPGKLKEFVDGQVRFEVLAAEARARGYEQDPEVEDAIKKIIVQRLTREEFDGRVQLKDVTDAELKTYFDAHKSDYQKPEMARASVVTVAFSDGKAPGGMTKAQAAAAAEQVRKEADAKRDDRAFFKSLVEKHSTDAATKAAGGDIRYLDKAEVEGRFGKAAAEWLFGADDVNAVSGVIETEGAFHVLKRTGKRKAIERDFEAVKNQIKNVVYREKRSAAFATFVDELKVKHKVSVQEDKFTKLKVNVSPESLQGDPHAGHGHGGGDVGHGGDVGGGADPE